MSRPPFDLVAVEAATRLGLMRGHRILQTFRYSLDDDEHVEMLLDLFNLPQGAEVIEAGCGIGEVCRLMAQQRPDLSFLMVNISPLQLSMCPTGEQFDTLLADWHALPPLTHGFDVVMFNSALVQMDEDIALAQAFHALRPGGILIVNEPVRVWGDAGALESLLACRTLAPQHMAEAIERAGFEMVLSYWPEFKDTYFRQLLSLDGLEHLLDGIQPLIVRARKPQGERDDTDGST